MRCGSAAQPREERDGGVAALDFLDQLNPEQRTAVLHRDGPLLILAGAGSGKTRVICYRLAHLIGNGYVTPEEVLAVTFTNKAADEMRERVEALLASEAPRLWVSTFHSFCARVLRRHGPRIKLSRDFVIYDTVDQLNVIRQAMEELRLDPKVTPGRSLLARISHAKNQLASAADVRRDAASFADEQLADVFELYTRTLVANQALDFDDLLLRTVTLFDESEDARIHYARRFRQVMIDEYQDTNRPQYLLVRHLAAEHRNLCVVGDPDQSIYAWRGADIRNILDFEADFPDATVVLLERNYRSTQVILDAATGVISRNRERKDKRLIAHLAGGDRVVYHQAGDELEEADFILRRLRDALGADADRAAVLYRTHAQSRALEDVLIRDGLPYRMVGGVRFYERKEVKDALAYLKLILNPDDDVSLRRILNVPARGIGPGVLERLEAVAPAPAVAAPLFDGPLDDDAGGSGGSPHSLWARIGRAVDGDHLPKRAHRVLASFRTLILSLKEVLACGASASETVSRTLEDSGYLQALRDARNEESEARLENLKELVSAAADYEMREVDPSLSGFVDRLSLLSEADEEEGAPNARVWLMSLHAAKGLEFPLVVIAGLEDGLLPHMRSVESDDDAAIEEERRLCYVGMTRAQSYLILTSAARRRVFGEYQSTEPSRFLTEIPQELVDVVEPAFTARPYRGGRRNGWSPRRYPLRRPAAAHRDEDAAAPPWDDADEDQSAGGISRGARVRHPTFGRGEVIQVEPVDGDLKLTVRFATVGRKKLLARYANLKRQP